MVILIYLFIAINQFVIQSETLDVKLYSGEKFPDKYLEPENYTPTTNDVNIYLNSLVKVFKFFSYEPNRTDPNVAIASFFVKGVIRRSISEDGHKFNPEQRVIVRHIFNLADSVLSHYSYLLRVKEDDKHELENDIKHIFKEDVVLAHALPDFNRNKLRQRILSTHHINEFSEDFDAATLPKDKFASLVNYASNKTSKYNIKIWPSDQCIARLNRNLATSPENKELKPCRHDAYCKQHMLAEPAIAYGLSHKLLLLFMYRSIRHCYWESPLKDELYMDELCAEMYREAVYLARRGFFARDLFLEHVGLCTMWGYTEFYRSSWYRKAVRWIDDDGCIHEDRNFSLNRSIDNIYFAESASDRERLIKIGRKTKREQCQSHPMAVLVMFLSSAIRHAIHFVKL